MKDSWKLIMFSDEAKFYTSMKLYHHNVGTWSNEHQHVRNSPKFNSWPAVLADQIMRLYLFFEKWSIASLKLLWHALIIRNLTSGWKTGHFVFSNRMVLRFTSVTTFLIFLLEVFRSVAGQDGLLQWSRRSPDATLLDLFVWGFFQIQGAHVKW